MGQDQTCAALELLGQCAAQGKWLCLKNIHLVATWLLKLEHAVHSLKPAPGFRLWLTTEASETFPQGLLESCLVWFQMLLPGGSVLLSLVPCICEHQ
jgi:dynein heavy chain 2, cytosolic